MRIACDSDSHCGLACGERLRCQIASDVGRATRPTKIKTVSREPTSCVENNKNPTIFERSEIPNQNALESLELLEILEGLEVPTDAI